MYYCDSCDEKLDKRYDRCPYCDSIDIVSWADRYSENFYDEHLESLEEDDDE